MPQVSVIIPNYNHSLYLQQRIETVLNQTFQSFELIILDDCSPDDSRDIIKKYHAHPKVSHIVFNEINSGSTFKQWKKGIELAQGEWIWIAESDDWCEPTFLEELVGNSERDSAITVAFCQSVIVSTERKIYTTSAEDLYKITDGKEFVKTSMLGVNRILNASMAIFKKKCFQNIPDDYLSMTYCGDWFVWVNLCWQGKVFVSGKYLNYYLRHENNVATKAIKSGYDFLEGNKVFTYIVNTIDVSLKEKENALNVKVDSYLKQSPLFSNENIKKQVYISMIALSPIIKRLLRKKRFERKQEIFLSALKRLVIIPFKMIALLKS